MRFLLHVIKISFRISNTLMVWNSVFIVITIKRYYGVETVTCMNSKNEKVMSQS